MCPKKILSSEFVFGIPWFTKKITTLKDIFEVGKT